jgi:hypothetical protein
MSILKVTRIMLLVKCFCFMHFLRFSQRLLAMKCSSLSPLIIILHLFSRLFNYYFSSFEYVSSSDRIINEMKRMWKEAIMALYDVVF